MHVQKGATFDGVLPIILVWEGRIDEQGIGNNRMRISEVDMKGDDLADRLLDLSVAVIELAALLPKTYTGRHIARQVIRSATAGGANYEEARGAQSRADFIHKMTLALKEARETLYWLKIMGRAKLTKSPGIRGAVKETNELVAILTKSIHTAKKKTNTR